MLMMGMEDYITLSPQLMGMTFVLLSISITFRLIEGRKRFDEDFLKIGLFSGLSALFYPLYVFLFIPIIIALIFFTNTVIRRYLLLIFGFILPLFLVWLKFYWYDQLSDFYFNLNFLIIPGNDGSIISWKGFAAIFLIPSVFLGYALFRVAQSTYFINYQVRLQKYYFLYVVTGILIIFLEYHQTSHILIVLVPVFAFFISHLFLMMKRFLVSEILFFTFLLLIIFQNYNASFEFIKGKEYFNFSKQYLKAENRFEGFSGEKILVLGGDTRKYYGNYLATPYLSWVMLEHQLDEMDHYNYIVEVFENFNKDLPYRIFDDYSVMPVMLSHIPELEVRYNKNGDQVYLLSPKNQ